MFCVPTYKSVVAVNVVKVPVAGVSVPMLMLSKVPTVPEVSVIAPDGVIVRLLELISINGAVKLISVSDKMLTSDDVSTLSPVNIPTLVKLLLTTELASVVVLNTSAPLIFSAPVASRVVTEKLPEPSTENPGLLKPEVDVSCFCITPIVVPICNYIYIYSVSCT